MKKIDKIIINVAAFSVFLILSYITVKNLAASIFIAFLLWITANRVIIHLLNRRRNTKKIPISQMEDKLALDGIKKQVELFTNATPPCFNPEKFDFGFTVTINCEKILVFPNYKFSACSLDDVAKFYRKAKEESINKIWVLSRLNSRNVILFANNLDVEFVFHSSSEVRKFLATRNALPQIPKKHLAKKNTKKANIKSALSDVFVKKRAKYFFLSAFSLAFLAIFTPLKIYYLILSVICIGMGIACLIRESA